MKLFQMQGKSLLDWMSQKEDSNILLYLVIVGAFALTGSIFGTLLDGGITAIQKQHESPWWVCFLYSAGQVLVSLGVYFFCNKMFGGSVKTYLFTTAAGFMFSLLYFGVQTNLYYNIRNVFPFLPHTVTN